MKNKFSRYDPSSYDEYAKWREICPEGDYRIVPPEAFRGLLPEALVAKMNSALVMASASASPPATVFLANANRVDRSASAVDQEPYLAVFYHRTSGASGGFLHHGGWKGRTTRMDQDFFDAVNASGINARFPLKEMPAASAGRIDALKVDSQREAFWTISYKYEKAKK